MEPLTLSIKSIVAATGQGRPSVFDAIREGHLKTFLVGRKRFARLKEVQAWMDFLEQQSSKGKPVCYRGKRAKEQSALRTAALAARQAKPGLSASEVAVAARQAKRREASNAQAALGTAGRQRAVAARKGAA